MDQIILLTLSRAWGCLPHPYTCHTLFVSHPLMGTILIQKPKATMAQPRKHHLSARKSYDVHWPYDELLPSHIRGNMLTQKIPHSALHGLHHPCTTLISPVNPHT